MLPLQSLVSTTLTASLVANRLHVVDKTADLHTNDKQDRTT